MDLVPGGLNLPTTKIRLSFQSDYPPPQLKEVNSLEFQDSNFPGRLGWKEIVAQAADGIELVQSSVPSLDKSQELSAYPQDPTVSPPQDLTARLSFRLPVRVSGVAAVQAGNPDVNASSSAPASASLARPFQQSDVRTQQEQRRLTQLLSSSALSLNVILLAMFVAFGLGAFHALSPGHGKTVVGAYLVGSRGTAKHAILLGGIVTITHTLGVFLLGLVTLYASKYILPEKLYPWLGFFSGLAVVVIGLGLFLQRYRNLYSRPSPADEHEHSRGHEQAHLHAHDHHAHHEHGHGHSDHDHHKPGHSHDATPHTHDHEHGSGGHHHTHEHHHHHHDHGHHDDASLTHTHGGITHTHDYSNVRFRDLFTLGVSGGIVPCPSALVVLLSAISLNRVGLGLLMIVAFSLGLALVLMAIGVLMVYARGFMERVGSQGRLWRTIPVFSPLIIAALGAVIAVQALVGAGIVQITISKVN